MADPGFPVGGRGLPRWICFEKFVCQNERIWILRLGRASGTPPRSANETNRLFQVKFPFVINCLCNFKRLATEVVHFQKFLQNTRFQFRIRIGIRRHLLLLLDNVTCRSEKILIFKNEKKKKNWLMGKLQEISIWGTLLYHWKILTVLLYTILVTILYM